MRVRIDETGQNGGLAQVDDLNARRDFDSCFGSDIRDAFALDKDHLAREHLAGLAVEETPSAYCGHSCCRCALNDAAIRAHARCRSRATPWGGRRLHLCPKC